MTLQITACERCGAQYFPRRLRCHRCGASAFQGLPVTAARVTAATQVHRTLQGCPWSWLVELEAGQGVRLIAAADSAPSIGATVRVQQQEDGAVVLISA